MTTPEREFLERCLSILEDVRDVLHDTETTRAGKMLVAINGADELAREMNGRLMDLIRQDARTTT